MDKCTGERSDHASLSLFKCPFRYSCRRFTSPTGERGQAYLVLPPYNSVTHSCNAFVSNRVIPVHEPEAVT